MKSAASPQPEPRETFRVTLGLAAPVGELEAWLAGASPRARAVYASGFDLPREAPGVALVRGWEREGKVTLVSERDPLDRRRTLWMVERVGAPDRPTTSLLEAGRDHETRRLMAALLDHLRWLAERRRACPSNARLAIELDLPPSPASRARVQYLLGLLAEAGSVKVDCRGRNAARVVTVLSGRARGKSTSGEKP